MLAKGAFNKRVQATPAIPTKDYMKYTQFSLTIYDYQHII